MFHVSPDFPQRPEIINFAAHRLVFIRGSLSYQDSYGSLTVVNENPFSLSFDHIGEKTTPEGHYILVIIPYSIDGQNADEVGVMAQTQVAVGHIRACLGKNGAFQHIFDNILHLGSDKTEVTSQSFEMPNWHPPVNMEPSESALLIEVGQAIDNLKPDLKARAKLALSWFNRGQSASDHIEKFINCWVALECFSDSDTHIKPLNQMLVQAYALTLNEVTVKFGLGRLQGMRSDIIHKGRIPVLDGLLQMYVEAIFTDLLCQFLSLPCPKRADVFLDHSRERLAPYIGAG